MNLLYLAHCVPSDPDKGDRIRAFHELCHLAARHRVRCLCLGAQPGDGERARDLRRLLPDAEVFPIRRPAALWRCLRCLPGRTPFTLGYFRSRSMARRVRELHGSGAFDAVIAYCTASAPYAVALRGVPRLLDMVDVDSAKWSAAADLASPARRVVYRQEAVRLSRYERRISTRFDRVFVTTSREAGLLRRLAPAARVERIANGIDGSRFARRRGIEATAPTLVFTGQMDYFPNVDGMVAFVHRVWPELKRRLPALRLRIVGRSPAPAVRSLERFDGVEVTGEVDDVVPHLSQAWVFVAPLRLARGVQNKVLEAMACELPVVCSGPVMAGLEDGLDGGAGGPLVANEPAEWASLIEGLVGDEERRRALGSLGRQAVLAAFDWSSSMERLEAALEEAVGLSPESAEPSGRSTAFAGA